MFKSEGDLKQRPVFKRQRVAANQQRLHVNRKQGADRHEAVITQDDSNGSALSLHWQRRCCGRMVRHLAETSATHLNLKSAFRSNDATLTSYYDGKFFLRYVYTKQRTNLYCAHFMCAATLLWSGQLTLVTVQQGWFYDCSMHQLN